MQQRKIRMLTAVGGVLAGMMLLGASAAQADATGPMLANTCAGCHGTNGISAGPAMPTIAGMPAKYLKAVMADFASGKRPSTIMGRLAKGYSEAEIALIADEFAKQKWQNAKSGPQSKMATAVNAKLAKEGEKATKGAKCDKCHEDNGVFQDDDTPRVAGQWLDYLRFKVQDLKNPELKVPQAEKMKTGIDKLSAEQLEAVAHFYASQK
ncbi:c-type cytochrome [Candidatus Magnetaquicoccus inordinatus]|uniref:c-type cytochrome n=1 Tax=Candidatus Magnetaquicoccus inordinatus TaxID=2496818 RepID=UPI00102AF2ED|nr:c-type cytochrome [Candidatus Magnetaquicoccus inordinatus]